MKHAKLRFAERYGLKLTPSMIRDLKTIAWESGKKYFCFKYHGIKVKFVYDRDRDSIITFLPI